MKNYSILLAIIGLAVISIFVSCKTKDKVSETEEAKITSEEKTETNNENIEQKIFVPEDVPEDAVLDFEIPEFPETDNSPIPSLPTDVKENASKIIPARETKEWNEECQVHIERFYDDQDRLIHEKHSNGFEKWIEYSEKGSRFLSANLYQEYDSKNREIYSLQNNNEWKREFTDHEGYSTYFERSTDGRKGWGKIEGNQHFMYSEKDDPSNGKISEWRVLKYDGPITNDFRQTILLNCTHRIADSQKRYFETWSVIKWDPEKEESINWEWSNEGYSCRTTSKRKNGATNYSRFYPRTGEVDMSEGFDLGYYSYYHELYNSKHDKKSISENNEEILETDFDTQKNEFSVKIHDPETKRSYTIYLTPDTLTYGRSKNGEKFEILDIYYDIKSNSSTHSRKKDWEDAPEVIFPKPEN